ncbi:MAG: hypothetical protein JSR46_07750 [Verrucomicrobia bacterium]|nr:hypothetical protein [Verrucomicrobiota bacterium]
METLGDPSLFTRKQRRAIIFKEIEKRLGCSISDTCSAFQTSRHKEIVEDLRQRISIKTKLDRLPISQPGKDEYFVDMEKEISLRTTDPLRLAQLSWDGSLPSDEQMMELVVDELERVEAISGVSSRKPEGWTLRLSGPAVVEEARFVTEETESESSGIKEFVLATISDLVISCLNIVSQNPMNRPLS